MSNTQSEARIQQDIVRWYRNTYCLVHHVPRCMIFSVPNEGRGANSAAMIQTGLYPGCADLVVVYRREVDTLDATVETEIIFVEVKTPTGVQSTKQKKFSRHCAHVRINYYIVRSLEQFKEVIENL